MAESKFRKAVTDEIAAIRKHLDTLEKELGDAIANPSERIKVGDPPSEMTRERAITYLMSRFDTDARDLRTWVRSLMTTAIRANK